ncbi:MAG TPA: YtxH domain-containing protein [Candidatus Obscuribacterales bacterium]
MARNSVNRYFEGLLVGGALGLVAGLLSAKKPGSELRKDLSESYEDLLRQANDQLGDLKGSLSDKVRPIAAQAADLKDRLSDRAAELRGQVAGVTKFGGKDLRTGGKELVDNFMGNGSGPMYTPGAKAAPFEGASSVADSCSTYSANKPEAASS